MNLITKDKHPKHLQVESFSITENPCGSPSNNSTSPQAYKTHISRNLRGCDTWRAHFEEWVKMSQEWSQQLYTMILYKCFHPSFHPSLITHRISKEAVDQICCLQFFSPKNSGGIQDGPSLCSQLAWDEHKPHGTCWKWWLSDIRRRALTYQIQRNWAVPQNIRMTLMTFTFTYFIIIWRCPKIGLPPNHPF